MPKGGRNEEGNEVSYSFERNKYRHFDFLCKGISDYLRQNNIQILDEFTDLDEGFVAMFTIVYDNNGRKEELLLSKISKIKEPCGEFLLKQRTSD